MRTKIVSAAVHVNFKTVAGKAVLVQDTGKSISARNSHKNFAVGIIYSEFIVAPAVSERPKQRCIRLVLTTQMPTGAVS